MDRPRRGSVNFLAHLYLAQCEDAFQTGNLMADFVRGRIESLDLPPALADGIRLHRHLDSFSDAHPLVRRSRRRFNGARRRVAGVLVDMVYDHFLARHWNRFHPDPLAHFTSRAYRIAARQTPHLPPRLVRTLTPMREQDWLSGYARLENVGYALDRMASRLRRGDGLRDSLPILRAAYEGLERDCLEFLPLAADAARRWRQSHLPAGGY